MSEEIFTSLTHVSPGLTNQLLDQGLSKWFNEEITFTHWQYVGGTGKGDSYLSEVIRIKVFGKNSKNEHKYIQIILKSIPKNVTRRLTYRSDEFFKNEIMFYTNIIPSFVKFQSTKNITEPFTNFPNHFLSYIDGVTDFISLEDVSTKNFVTYAVRQEGIDLAHCKVTLKTFAKFHAVSFAMKDQDPKEFEHIRTMIFETYYHKRLWGWYEKFWARLCSIAIDAVEKEYPNSVYAEKVKEFAKPERYFACIEAACNTLDTGVISHGDSWTNNFLYKYENDTPVDAIMIDFQLTRCASPVLDISFFVYACTSQELREKHYTELMEYYYDVLSEQIRELGSDPDKVYSRKLFWEEIKKYSYFGLAFSFESTPFIIMAPEDAPSMDHLTGDKKLNIDDFWPLKPIKSKEGRLRLANNVVHCVDNGFI